MTERVIHLKDFFEEARAGRLVAIRCDRCGELAVPPKEFCPACHERAWSLAPLSGEGTVASFTVVRVAPHSHQDQVPYAVVVVRMAEGVSLLGRVVDIALEDLRIGLPVRFRPITSGAETAIGFGPP